MSRSMGYRPNIATRLLSQKSNFAFRQHAQAHHSFWDEVRAGIHEEAKALGAHDADVEFRGFPGLGEGEEEAFETITEFDS